jgi:hypothetical protein
MLPDLTPPALAGAINGLLRDAIDRHKRAALEAAKSLNWETEGARLLAALDALTAGDARAAKSG